MNDDEDGYSGLLGIYAEADRHRRGVFYPGDGARVAAIVVGVGAVLFILFALVSGV